MQNDKNDNQRREQVNVSKLNEPCRERHRDEGTQETRLAKI